MGWKWKDILPFSSCLCFRKKGWEAVPDQEDEPPRRGAMSYDRADKNAQYVRKLVDTKGKPEPLKELRRPSQVLEQEISLLERVKPSEYRNRSNSRFHTAQGTRRRRRVALKVSSQNEPVLDNHYVGQAQCLLATADDWHFNVFNLDKLTNGRPLFHMCLHLFQSHGFIEEFNLDIVRLMRCLTMIEEGYHITNPYHNSVHAADVTQAMHCYLTENKVAQCVSPLEAMVALIAAATHDLDHPGVNQTFLIATSNHLAALYKNSSVLENHHWRTAVGVIRESGIFDHFSSDQWAQVECQLRSLILATDITRQQEFLSRFKTHIDDDDLNLNDKDQRHLMLQIALKCADICNPCRPWTLSKRWSEQVCDEFFKQGDVERQLGIDVSALCDRYATTIAKIQVGFMQFVVLPLFLEWQHFNPTVLSKKMVHNIQSNKSSWEKIVTENESEARSSKSTPSGGDVDSDKDLSEKDNSSDEGVTQVHVTETAIVHMEDSGSADVVMEGELAPVKENIDLSMYFGRRHSVPFSLHRHGMEKQEPEAPVQLTKENFLQLTDNIRRHSLPTSSLLHSNSLNHLREKLASLAESSPTNGSRIFSKEELMGTPNIASLTPMDTLDSNSNLNNSGQESAQKSRAPLSVIAQNSSSKLSQSVAPGAKIDLQKLDLSLLQRLNPNKNCTRLNHHGALYESLYGKRRGSGDSVVHQRLLRAAQRLPPISSSGEKLATCEEVHNTCCINRDLLSVPYDRPRSLSLEYETTHSMLLGSTEQGSLQGESGEQDPYATVTLLRQPPWFTAKSDSSTCLLSDSGSGEGS